MYMGKDYFAEFVEKANKKYLDKFTCHRETYKGSKKQMLITCPEHGLFYQTPDKHINAKEGYPLCKSNHMEETIRRYLLSNNISFNE